MYFDTKSFDTPLVLIVFNRPEQTQLIFSKIKKLKPKNLFIISDGAREEVHGEEEKVIQVRKIFDDIDWDCNIEKNFSILNLGVKKRISSGLDWVFSLVGEAIILEDDCLPADSFFQFCEELLDRYRNDLRVGMISGNNYWPNQEILKESYGFSKYMLTWGWATWGDRWNSFDYELKNWHKALVYGVLNNLFKKNIEILYWKKIYNKSYVEWDYCWVFTNWIQNRLCIFPRVNLISNIGFGDGATNTTNGSHHLANYPLEEIEFPLIHPKIFVPNCIIETEISKRLYSISTLKWLRSVIRELYYVDLLIKKIKILLSQN